MPKAIKISDELADQAREAARTWSRSMTQQIEHWARLGRSIESRAETTVSTLEQLLDERSAAHAVMDDVFAPAPTRCPATGV